MELAASFEALSTPLIADACVRLTVPMHLAPPGLSPIRRGDKAAGPVLPVRHYGSVDVFLEAFESAQGGEVAVIDNGGRTDEGCIGDLTVLEAKTSGLGGMLVWGLHRDSTELVGIDFPVFTYGAFPAGPQRLDSREPEALATARFGNSEVGADHVVFADDDGALFVSSREAAGVLAAASTIHEVEREQANRILAGTTIREQLRFSEYLEAKAADPSYSFRKHLRAIGGAIEE